MPSEPVLVTTAGLSVAEDRRRRTRRYLLTQGVRVACVLLAVLLPVDPGWKIGLIAASIALPWVGVVAANGGPRIDRRRPVPVTPPAMTSLPAATRVIDADR